MTQREMEVLLMFARGDAVARIAERLCVSSKTVSNHLALLKSKLQVESSIELVHLAVDAGLVRFGQGLDAGNA
jgi:DNA-binding NarL/FixJ family response regulator